MYLLNSYKFQLILLLASIIVGIYTLISIYDSTKTGGTVTTLEGVIINQVNKEPFTGKVVDTIANQIITFEVKEGLKNGNFSIYNLEGKKTVSGEILNNKNDGKWCYYYNTGELESEGYFKNDIVVGEWIWYYSNGNKMEEGTFINGKREGLWKLFNMDGSLKTTVFFNEGNMVRSFKSETPSAS